MLSSNQVVTIRNAIETLYNGLCTVTCNQEIESEDGSTEFEQVVICENQPCHLSFGSARTQEGNSATGISQSITLFVAPELEIPAGSKIVVLQNEREWKYKTSTVAAVYDTHQEITFSLEDRWA